VLRQLLQRGSARAVASSGGTTIDVGAGSILRTFLKTLPVKREWLEQASSGLRSVQPNHPDRVKAQE